jgi:mycofactocin system glycosyltransferase
MTELPEGFGVALDPSVRVYAGGTVLVGGDPVRVLRLTSAGVDAVAALGAGGRGSPAARRLGRRLVDAGLAHPRPAGPQGRPDVTVVVPVRDHAASLDRCLQAVGGEVPVVVVDDGSTDPPAVAAVAARHGARLLVRPVGGGPAAARGSALPELTTELVAFLDSDCVPPPGWIAALAGHFGDPLVGAVAPRVRPALVEGAALPRFLAARSPLDMGRREAAVGPMRAVPYVPTAALLVRRAALGAGFDRRLRYGEDVDLVWRMADAGWRVRYQPAVVVRHLEPSSWGRLLARRFRYGTSAAPLARRHPGRLAPVVLRPWPSAAVALLLAGRPASGLAAVGVAGALLARRLRRAGAPAWLGPTGAAQAATQTLLGLGRAGTTLAGPALLLAAAGRGRARWPAVALLAGPPLAEWWRRRPTLDPVRWTAASVADDLAYGAGVWWGCLVHRSAGPLLPLVRAPGPR